MCWCANGPEAPHTEPAADYSCCALQMMEDHLSDRALVPALRFATEHHPTRLSKPSKEKARKKEDGDRLQNNASQVLDPLQPLQ